MVELRQLGGALRERARRRRARRARRLVRFFASARRWGPARRGGRARIGAIKGALAPWSRGKPYLNFAEKQVAIGDAVGAEAFARLERIKASVDPDGGFRSAHRFARRRPRRATR